MSVQDRLEQLQADNFAQKIVQDPKSAFDLDVKDLTHHFKNIDLYKIYERKKMHSNLFEGHILRNSNTMQNLEFLPFEAPPETQDVFHSDVILNHMKKIIEEQGLTQEWEKVQDKLEKKYEKHKARNPIFCVEKALEEPFAPPAPQDGRKVTFTVNPPKIKLPTPGAYSNEYTVPMPLLISLHSLAMKIGYPLQLDKFVFPTNFDSGDLIDFLTRTCLKEGLFCNAPYHKSLKFKMFFHGVKLCKEGKYMTYWLLPYYKNDLIDLQVLDQKFPRLIFHEEIAFGQGENCTYIGKASFKVQLIFVGAVGKTIWLSNDSSGAFWVDHDELFTSIPEPPFDWHHENPEKTQEIHSHLQQLWTQSKRVFKKLDTMDHRVDLSNEGYLAFNLLNTPTPNSYSSKTHSVYEFYRGSYTRQKISLKQAYKKYAKTGSGPQHFNTKILKKTCHFCNNKGHVSSLCHRKPYTVEQREARGADPRDVAIQKFIIKNCKSKKPFITCPQEEYARVKWTHEYYLPELQRRAKTIQAALITELQPFGGWQKWVDDHSILFSRFPIKIAELIAFGLDHYQVTNLVLGCRYIMCKKWDPVEVTNETLSDADWEEIWDQAQADIQDGKIIPVDQEVPHTVNPIKRVQEDTKTRHVINPIPGNTHGAPSTIKFAPASVVLNFLFFLSQIIDQTSAFDQVLMDKLDWYLQGEKIKHHGTWHYFLRPGNIQGQTASAQRTHYLIQEIMRYILFVFFETTHIDDSNLQFATISWQLQNIKLQHAAIVYILTWIGCQLSPKMQPILTLYPEFLGYKILVGQGRIRPYH